MPSALRSSLALLAAAALAACGSSDSTPTPTPTPAPTKNVTMNGGVTVFPPAVPFLGGATVDLSKFQLEVLDPLKVLLGRPIAEQRVCTPNTGPLAVAAAGTYSCAVPDATTITLGIIGNAIDTNATKIQSVVTSSGVHLPFCSSVACTNVTPGQVFNDAVPAFIIPDVFHTTVGALYSPVKTAAQLGTAGVIVVFVVNRTTGTAVSGATLTVPATHSVLYPNDTFTGVGTTTGVSGVAYVTGPPTASPINIVATKLPSLPACTATVTTGCLSPAQAGLQPGLAFVAPVTQQ